MPVAFNPLVAARTFQIFYQGHSFKLPILTEYELKVMSYIASNPGLARCKQADGLGINVQSLNNVVSNLNAQWTSILEPDVMEWTAKDRFKLTLEIFEHYQTWGNNEAWRF